MALFKRIHEVALLLLNLFKLSSQKKPKITNTLKVGTSNGSRLGCHVMWVYLVFFFLSHPCSDSFLSHYVFPYPHSSLMRNAFLNSNLKS